MDEDESSEDAGRIERLQRQARRRLVNRHAAHQSTDTTATLPEYTSSPPKYPLTAEEADEERDEVGDVVRRVRLRRKRSGSDSYLDSLLARSVHALELSNALLQSSMTTQSSLSALLSHDENTLDRSLDSHARFLASQIQASDSRRAFVDDITRHLDTTLSASPLGLSQSLPDTQNTFLSQDPSPRKRESGLQQGDRPRSPPPRCMTVYADTSLPSDTILIPSTNGLRSLARVHDFVPTSRNHSRQSSVSDEGVFARQQGYRTPPRTARRTSSIQTHSSNPSTSTGYSVYQHGNGNVSSPVLSSPHRIARRTRSQLLPHSPVQQQQFSSHQPAGPVQPVLSSLPAEPSTAAYNLLSSIATRSPSASESEAPRKPSLDTGTVRGRGAGKFAPLGVVHKSSGAGLRRTRSVTPSGSALASPLVPDSRMQVDSPASSRLQADSPFSTRQADSPFTTRVPAESLFPPQTDSPSSTRSKPSRSGSTTSSIPTTSQHTPISPNRRVVRHPFLQPPHPHDSSVSDTEGDGRKLQRYKSAQVLRRILDVAQQKAEEEAARKREEELRAAEEAKVERGRPSRRPTWSVIPRTATVAVETVASEGIVSIQGITAGTGTSSRGQSTLKVVTEPDPLVLPGEFSVPGSSIAGPSTARTSTTGTFLSPAESAARSIPQRSQSAGPSNRVATLLGASLPKISVFGIGAVGEPPPNEPESAKVDKGKGKAVDSPSPRPALRLRLNSTDVDMDAEAVNSSSDSECESQPSQASLRPARLFDSTSSIARPSSLRLPGSPRSGTSTPRSVTFSPLPPKHISSGRPMSDAKTRRKKPKKEEEKPGWFASWFGPLPAKSAGYGPARRGWDSPRSMDDWQM